MCTCDTCGKTFKNLQGLGVHKSFHVNPKSRRPQVPFEDLKKDRTRKFRLIEERGHQCEVCKIEMWMNKPTPLQLDHIDGHPGHNEKENLRLICPNCHAQTEHYCGANAGKHSGTKRQKVMSRYPNYRKQKIYGPITQLVE